MDVLLALASCAPRDWVVDDHQSFPLDALTHKSLAFKNSDAFFSHDRYFVLALCPQRAMSRNPVYNHIISRRWILRRDKCS